MTEAKFPPRASCTVGSNWIDGVLQGMWKYSQKIYEYLSLDEHNTLLAAEKAKSERQISFYEDRIKCLEGELRDERRQSALYLKHIK